MNSLRIWIYYIETIDCIDSLAALFISYLIVQLTLILLRVSDCWNKVCNGFHFNKIEQCVVLIYQISIQIHEEAHQYHCQGHHYLLTVIVFKNIQIEKNVSCKK